MKRRLLISVLLTALAGLIILISWLFGGSFLWYSLGVAVFLFALAFVSGDAKGDISGLGKTGDGSGP